MRTRGIPPAHNDHPNVTPLIDVVMCLIIFYMLVAKIGVATGIDEKVELPASIIGMKLEDVGNTINLNVSEGFVHERLGPIPTVTTLDPSTGNLVEVKVLTEAAERPLEKFLTRMKQQNPNFSVNVRADAKLAYRYLEPVLITCANAGVKNVNYAAKQAQAEVRVIQK
jgi:biopolymer transport protein ExbD